jgi:hypothetical protein
LSQRPVYVEEMFKFLRGRPGQEAPMRLVVEHGMRFVPAGPASREGTAKRRRDAHYRGSGDELAALENQRVVRVGSRRFVLKALHYEANVSGRMKKFQRDGRRWVKLVSDSEIVK